MTSSHPAMGSATHVVFDPLVSERLSELGASNVVCTSDGLVIGPSCRDAVQHARARAAWWGSPDESDRLCSPSTRWAPPIVVWTSANPLDRLNLWRTCSWLRHRRISPRDVLVIAFDPVPGKGAPRPRCSESVADQSDEQLLKRLERAHPWRPARHDRAVALWDKYVDANLQRFARACQRGVEGFPELASLWELLSAFFPRQTPDGALRLSRFDELMFTVLAGEWQTPVAIFLHEALRELVSCTGDLFLPRRLDAWADHGSAPAVERAVGPKPHTPMLSSVYRLTEHGRRLRAEGLAQVADAPRLPVAGTAAYAPEAPWVLLDDGRRSSRSERAPSEPPMKPPTGASARRWELPPADGSFRPPMGAPSRR
jgi:hypothetical protein